MLRPFGAWFCIFSDLASLVNRGSYESAKTLGELRGIQPLLCRNYKNSTDELSPQELLLTSAQAAPAGSRAANPRSPKLN